jgi:hypothetical protein
MNDTQAIAQAIQLYFDGLYDGDTAKLARAFHPAAQLYGVDDGAVKCLARDAWLSIVANRPAPRASGALRTDEILSIDGAEGTHLASARVRLSVPPRHFVDHLTLLRTPEHGWQIVCQSVPNRNFRTRVTNRPRATYPCK